MRSTDRILTTHVGSLPRPPALVEQLSARYARKPYDRAKLDAEIEAALASVVRRQREAGIDIPGDGEVSKISFSQYICDRFSGFEPGTETIEIGTTSSPYKDVDDFPGLSEEVFGGLTGEDKGLIYRCVDDIALSDPDAVHVDIARFTEALGDLPPSQAFMNAPTPGQIVFNFPNDHYSGRTEYLAAAAEAMRYEYLAITGAGFNLQLDSPDLAMIAHAHHLGPDAPEDRDLAWHRAYNDEAVDALNQAIRGIPPEQLRLHVCWGNYGGPHHHDVALEAILEPLFRADVQTFSFEAANPRHAHEWELFGSLELPEGKVIMPGLIDVTTNRIEHPRLVAQRLVRFAGLVGRENVVAGTDCGFSTIAGWEHVHPDVVWPKLATLAEGARLASEELWG
jgi:5-methyltetrahydropteroyltriglutamate--homocysteine methyltransferase